MNLDPLIRACQKAVGAEPDGQPGPDTWPRIYKAVTGKEWGSGSVTVISAGDQVSDRSEKLIATLLPQVQPYARALIHAAKAQGITIEVTSATRTYDEQAKLYAQGRTAPGKVVTNAKPGSSWHNHSAAFDCTIFSGKTPVWESPLYKVVGSLGMGLGLEWGGSWKGSLVDEPHFQMTNGRTLAEARALHEAGRTVFG